MKIVFKKKILALGGHLKGRFCFVSGASVKFSPVLGNLGDPGSLALFEKAIKPLRPDAVAYDLHPEYASTRIAMDLMSRLKIKGIGVQHHHAHIASCMAEHGLSGNVIGVSFDGTGFGQDGNIWGGEFLICGYRDFNRAAHLEYIRLPGGEKAILEPWRTALSLLYEAYGQK
ncbi:MAG: carbamoyltransferase HypF, partial [Candidatus Omnitrophota bacterium]